MIGVCSVCHKAIPSPKLLINFSGKLYHTTCFNCSSCGKHWCTVLASLHSLTCTGCSMTGQPIYERNGSILCVRDFQRLSGPQAVPNSHQIQHSQVHNQSQSWQRRQQQHYGPYNHNQQVCLSLTYNQRLWILPLVSLAGCTSTTRTLSLPPQTQSHAEVCWSRHCSIELHVSVDYIPLFIYWNFQWEFSSTRES